MKIERKIILSNALNLALILLIGAFAIDNLNRVLTKLRFVEIADDLNASFLEMRLSEKNYSLYHDDVTLIEIQDKIGRTMQSIEAAKADIVRAVGENNFRMLLDHISRYSEVVDEIKKSNVIDETRELRLRVEGKALKEFSETITRLERSRVNDIISASKKFLVYSFWAVIISAVLVSHFISQKILISLRAIEKVTKAISEGNFHKIEGIKSKDEMGSVISAINSMSEELKNREEELIQSKKLASLGILTAGVAHELTNPLNNISMIAQNHIELYDYLSKENSLELLSKIEGEAHRIEAIVRNLLDFSKPKDANLREADINETVRMTLRLIQNSLDVANIEVSLSLDPGLPHIYIDEHQFQQVLVNLVINAIQAMQPGGVLSISTCIGKSPDTVRIKVRDTGKGIPPEFIPHIFDPFFSTKGVGGTGLGLSVSYGIIKNHNGTIKVDSKVGEGTVFTIELPRYKAQEE